MKLKLALAFEGDGERQAVVVVKGMRSPMFGLAMHPGGKVLVAYETTDGAPGANVVRALRDIADSLEKGGHSVHDITPIIPQAEA